MANDFSTIKNNQASEKFYLVRINPSRILNDDLSSIGGGQYTVTLSGFFLNAVKENGSSLTLVTSSPSTGEYSFNESTGLLTVNPTAAPSVTNAIVADYYLFYTSGRFRVVTEDPDNTSTSLRDWLPRILTSPVINASAENIIHSTFSVSISDITLINNENEFQAYLGDNDSFFKKEIKIWLALDNVENIQKIFDGKVTTIRIDNQEITISFQDPFSDLIEPALMGDDSGETYFTKDDFVNLDPNREGLPIPYIVGTSSRYRTQRDTSIIGLDDAQKLDESTLYEASCTSFSTTISTTTNREWGVCRVSTDGFLDFSFTPSNIDNSAGGYTRLDGTAVQVDKFQVGDTFEVTHLGTPVYVRAVYIDRTNNYIYVTKDASLATNDPIVANDCPSIVITNEIDETYYALWGRDYTTSVTATSGGNKYLKITFTNNFEANHAGLTAIDPTFYFVKFKVRPNTTNAKHGSVLKSLLEAAGLTTNAASFTAANTALSVNANFSIPTFDEDDHDTYLKYIEDIMKSTLGYVALNNSFEIVYNLFGTPSSSTEITDTDIIRGSFKVEIDYQDIVNQIISFNPHYSSAEATEDATDTPSVTETSVRAKHLHGINRTTRFRHVLESMNSRLPDIMKVRTERFAVYNFSTKLLNIDNIIGDNFKLVTSRLLGGVANEQVKILALDKAPDRTTVICSDLLNI